MSEHTFVAARKMLEREAARTLRAQGFSVGAIADRLGVSRSSVSAWVRDVPLSEQQRAALASAGGLVARQRLGASARSARRRQARLDAQLQGRAMARAGSALHHAGCMLFWAEGSRNRNRVCFTNADPVMHRYFLRFLFDCYGVESNEVALTINCFLGNGLSLDEIEAWWLERLDLPPECLRKSTVNVTPSSSRGTHRKLAFGTARVVVHSTDLVQSIYGAIQEYTGVDRPEWLDLDHPSRPVMRPERLERRPNA